MNPVFAAAALACCLAACAPEPSNETGSAPGDKAGAPSEGAPPPASPSPPAPPSGAPPAADVLTLAGLDALRIGRPVPAGSGWAEDEVQISDSCRTVGSPDFPGVYAIVEGGRVRRITLGERSDVKLAAGIGVGATEAEVRAAFPGLRESPHEYVGAPAKYLTAPDADGGGPALRFEIGADGKIGLIHVGTMPVLGYVEGWA